MSKVSFTAHKIERTCSICRRKFNVHDLIKFIITTKGYCFDLKRQFPTHGMYFCKKCESKLENWIIKHKKRKKRNARRKN